MRWCEVSSSDMARRQSAPEPLTLVRILGIHAITQPTPARLRAVGANPHHPRKRHDAVDGGVEVLGFHGFGHIAIHTCGETTLFIALHERGPSWQ